MPHNLSSRKLPLIMPGRKQFHTTRCNVPLPTKELNEGVELASWMGGFYERLVGIVKGALKKSIGKICLTEKKLETFLAEAEAVINSRPLVYVGEDFGSGFSLTPADFLRSQSQVRDSGNRDPWPP